MKHIEVCAAIIIENNKIFIAQRKSDENTFKREFPGGKIEGSESLEDCIIREIKEELNADIIVDKYLNKIDYDYPTFHITMHNFICHLKNKNMTLLEHKEGKFIGPDELDTIDFFEADKLLINDLKKYFSK